MIDNDKLNLAHMLAEKLAYDGWLFDITFSENKIRYRLVFEDEKEMLHDYYFVGIDELIDKLQELTQPDEPKPTCPLCGNHAPDLYQIPKKCQHESDGLDCIFSHPGEIGTLLMQRCIKCGEFYK